MLLVFSIDEVFKDEFEEREYKLLQLSYDLAAEW